MNDNSVIEPVVHHGKASHPHVEDLDLPPIEIHRATVIEDDDEDLPEICSECARPTKKHTPTQAFKCMNAREKRLDSYDHDDDDDDDEDEPTKVIAAPAPPPPPPPPPAPRPPMLPGALSSPSSSSWSPPAEPVTPPPRPTDVAGFLEVQVDYSTLAAEVRRIVEEERNEVIRRGGPIEKQNIQLKERLASALEDANMWRARCQAAFAERNSYKEQLEEAHKTNRKLRNDYRLKKEQNHVRLVELEDILAVVRKASGWTCEMGGNGHWQIKKNGVFITDAAGSGGSTRVNMATRTKLRKAGLEV